MFLFSYAADGAPRGAQSQPHQNLLKFYLDTMRSKLMMD